MGATSHAICKALPLPCAHHVAMTPAQPTSHWIGFCWGCCANHAHFLCFCDCANISGAKFVESSDDDPANDSSGIGSENANCNVCPICLGHPGTLPILNEEVKMMAIKTGKIGHKRRNLLEDDIQGLS